MRDDSDVRGLGWEMTRMDGDDSDEWECPRMRDAATVFAPSRRRRISASRARARTHTHTSQDQRLPSQQVDVRLRAVLLPEQEVQVLQAGARTRIDLRTREAIKPTSVSSTSSRCPLDARL